MSTAKSALTPSFSKLEIAVTTSALAPVCAWVTLSPANRAITKSEIHNTRYFAFIVVILFPHEDQPVLVLQPARSPFCCRNIRYLPLAFSLHTCLSAPNPPSLAGVKISPLQTRASRLEPSANLAAQRE